MSGTSAFQRELQAFCDAGCLHRARGERLFMAYDANQINADPIVPSFLDGSGQQTTYRSACRARCPLSTDPDPTRRVCTPVFAPRRFHCWPRVLQALMPLSSTRHYTRGADDQQRGISRPRIEDTRLHSSCAPTNSSPSLPISPMKATQTTTPSFTLRRRFSSGLA